MIWDILSGKRGEGRKKDRDEFDPIVDRIERFAPRKYRPERGQFYYNYKILPLYRKPLMDLLTVIAQGGGKDANLKSLTNELFQSLKEFYDPKAKLSSAAATEDMELMRRYAELFVIFYGMKRPKSDEVRRWLLDPQ